MDFKIEHYFNIANNILIVGKFENPLFSGILENEGNKISVVPVYGNTMDNKENVHFQVKKGVITKKDIGKIYKTI